MKLAALFSGGKDSTYAIYLAKKMGYEVKYLLTIFPESKESWMFHHPCIEMTKVQAELMGIKQLIRKTKGEKEKELEDLRKLVEKVKDEVSGLLSGALASNYQKERVDRIAKEFGLESIAPLWKKDRAKSLEDEIKEGFEIMVTGVATQGMNENWLGRILDLKTLNELKKLSENFGIDVGGEGGEYETLVLDCPLFSKKIVVKNFEKIWDKKTNSGYIVIKDFDLVEKENLKGRN
ncbi:MAG: TIGR00289 family protein [Candidatus Aenigmarchaeota archaeon ex4484_224]|nr:MAG: TIGR00289 family protein [Candidatus Aenigmarchaeota archaeon ex4484_224]